VHPEDATSAADGFLLLLRHEPTLLPAAPEWETEGWVAINRRLREQRSCLKCGEWARSTSVAETTLGPRWLDLCCRCLAWVMDGASPGAIGEVR
jgi:hypothetical protein